MPHIWRKSRSQPSDLGNSRKIVMASPNPETRMVVCKAQAAVAQGSGAEFTLCCGTLDSGRTLRIAYPEGTWTILVNCPTPTPFSAFVNSVHNVPGAGRPM